jgi:hypothetical protein
LFQPVGALSMTVGPFRALAVVSRQPNARRSSPEKSNGIRKHQTELASQAWSLIIYPLVIPARNVKRLLAYHYVC